MSVDGLDVIDGETADFVGKRGYVIPAGGELRLEGWRVSTAEVAAFRFSSVRSSYAGRKGQPRNVGVIGVAIFREREQPQMIIDEPVYRGGWRDEYDGDPGSVDESSGGDDAPEAAQSPPPRPSADSAERSVESTGTLGGATAPRGRSEGGKMHRRQTDRAGLGTGFGENRHSAVMWTRFERENPSQPTALAELRYNDATGLAALGVPIQPQLPDEDEMAHRETADPFPGTRFATPPK
jgi:hypothetical protein